MRKKSGGLAVFLLVLILASLCPINALAAGKIEPDSDASLTISYKDASKAIPNAEFDLYKVMNVDEYGHMTLTTEFETYRNTIDGLTDLENMNQDKWSALAATLKGYVQRDKLDPADSGKTNEKGALAFHLKPGLYLVIGYRATTDDYYTYTATPFMVFLPGDDPQLNAWKYDITVKPKYEKEYFPPEDWDPVITRKVLKLWDDAGYESIRPKEVVVQLLRDGTVYDTVALNAGNNWRYAWDNLEARYEWTIVEKELPNYAVTVEQKGITYCITNKYEVPIISVDPPVQKRVIGDTPEKAGTFWFVLTANDPSYPMPAGSNGTKKEISITGAGSAEFGEIVFTKPGTYRYTISEKNTGEEGYTYDETVYTLFFKVTQENGVMKVERTISDNKSNISTKVEFTNSYKTPGNKIPQTGVLWWPVPALLLVGCVFVMTGIIRRRRCD